MAVDWLFSKLVKLFVFSMLHMSGTLQLLFTFNLVT